MIRNKISIKLACYSRFQILIITEFTIVISCLKFKYHYNSYNHLTISQIPTTIYSPKIILNIATLLKFTIITQIIINNHSKTNNLNQKKKNFNTGHAQENRLSSNSTIIIDNCNDDISQRLHNCRYQACYRGLIRNTEGSEDERGGERIRRLGLLWSCGRSSARLTGATAADIPSSIG